MVSVDDHTTNAIEMVSESAVLTETVLLKLFEALNAFLGKNKDKDISNQMLSDNTKDGKQKIKDLIAKHEDGVVALDENLTKAQVNDYQKELKKLGVDFSVVKNEDNTHSFFFAASQANVIEKALKNVVEKKTAVLEKPAVKETEKELAEIKQALEPEQVKSTKELYDKVSDLPIDKPIPKDIDKKLEGLSDKEKALYAKLEEVDTLKKGLYTQEVDRVESLYAEKNGVEKEPTLKEKSQPLAKSDDEKLLDKVKVALADKGIDLSKLDPQVIKENVSNLSEKVDNKVLNKLAEKGIVLKGNDKQLGADDKKMEFTVNAVKEKTKEIKEQDKENDKDKTKKKELSR